MKELPDFIARIKFNEFYKLDFPARQQATDDIKLGPAAYLPAIAHDLLSTLGCGFKINQKESKFIIDYAIHDNHFTES